MVLIKFKIVVLLALVVLLVACATQPAQPVCNKPYILVGNNCCLDKDDNSICDKDEQQKVETSKVKETPKPEIKNLSTKTAKEEKVEKEELDDDSQNEIDELHWTHMPLTYHIFNPSHYGKDCGVYESNKIRKGFSRIQSDTNGVVHFKEIKNLSDADIAIRCSYIEDCYEYNAITVGTSIYVTESICAHTKGVASITESEGNKILKAEIEMIGLFGFSETKNKGPSGFFFGSCGHPSTEIHEILHTFAYEHVNDTNSIMYFQDDVMGATRLRAGECVGSRKEIDSRIVEGLIKTYSE